MTAEPLCGVAYCPWPSSPDMHRCLVCGLEGVEHHHVERRSQAPSRTLDPSNVVILCRRHHELVTSGPWHDAIESDLSGRRYVVRDRAGETIISRRVPPPGSAGPLERSPIVEALTRLRRPVVALLGELAAVMDEATHEELEWAYGYASAQRTQGYWLQCLVADACRARYAPLHPDWAQWLARDWGIDETTVRRDARLGEVIRSVVPTLDSGELEALSEATDGHLRVIAEGSVANKAEALRELARWLPEAGDRRAKAFAAHLRRLGLKGSSAAYTYRCPACGYVGRLRDFRTPGDET